MLLKAAEDWARSQGCSEFASDTRADVKSIVSRTVATPERDLGVSYELS
jgi:sarcosine oxidase delta subunit